MNTRTIAGVDIPDSRIAVALHATPEVPEHVNPVMPATTATPEADVLGLRLEIITASRLAEITSVRPRPDFTNETLEALTAGFSHHRASTFETVDADVLEHFSPGFERTDFVEVIVNSAWPE